MTASFPTAQHLRRHPRDTGHGDDLSHLGLQARAPSRRQRAGRLHCTPPEYARPMAVHSAQRQGLRGSAAPGRFKTGARRPTRSGNSVNEPADGHV